MLISYQLDEVCPSVSSLYFSTGLMLRTLCVWFGKWTLHTLLMKSACKLCFGCLGAGCVAPPFFPPKVILPLDHVLGLVCHLGVVIPPQWITKRVALARLSDSSLTDSTCCPSGFCVWGGGRGGGGAGHSWSKLTTWLPPLQGWSLNLHPHCWPLKS